MDKNQKKVGLTWTAEDVIKAAANNGVELDFDTANEWLKKNQTYVAGRLGYSAEKTMDAIAGGVDWDQFRESVKSGSERKKIAAWNAMMEHIRLFECVYDISLIAEFLIKSGKVEIEDSRELFSTVLKLATEFESAWDDDRGLDYMEEIEDYALHSLKEEYGKDGDHRE